jgi:beta-aspartyl-dipeptidase (metallo-type)
VLTLCVGDIKCLFDDWRRLLQAGLTMEDSIKVVTSNPARRAGLQRSKGRLDVGMDADLLILNRDLGIDSVLAKSRLMVDRGKVLSRGTFEE